MSTAGLFFFYLCWAIVIIILIMIPFLIYKLIKKPHLVQCCISGIYLPIEETLPFKGQFIEKSLFEIMDSSIWQEILSIKTSANDPEKGVRLFEKKQSLYEAKKIPLLINASYIVEGDSIATVLTVMARAEDLEIVMLWLGQN